MIPYIFHYVIEQEKPTCTSLLNDIIKSCADTNPEAKIYLHYRGKKIQGKIPLYVHKYPELKVPKDAYGKKFKSSAQAFGFAKLDILSTHGGIMMPFSSLPNTSFRFLLTQDTVFDSGLTGTMMASKDSAAI